MAYALVGALGSDSLIAAYAMGMAAAGLVGTVVDFGSGLWVVRRLADDPALPRLTEPRVATAAACAAALLCAALLGVLPLSAIPWVLAIGVTTGSANLWRGVLWARLRHATEAKFAVAQASLLMVGLVLVLLANADASAAPLIAVAAATTTGYLMRYFKARRLVQRSRQRVGIMVWVRETYSYFGQSAVTSAQVQTDVLLLGALWVGPAAGVAAYGLAMRFYYAIGMPFEALATAILPRVARKHPIPWRRLVAYTVPLAAVSMAALVALTALGSEFGLSAEGSAYLVALGLTLTVAVPFRCAAYVLGAVVTGSGRQTTRFRAAVLSLATMLALDVLLIPRFGPMGAAVALVSADMMLTGGYAWATRRVLTHRSQLGARHAS